VRSRRRDEGDRDGVHASLALEAVQPDPQNGSRVTAELSELRLLSKRSLREERRVG